MLPVEPIAFAADRMVSYPTEVVRFFVRLGGVEDSGQDAQVRIYFPPELAVEKYSHPRPDVKVTVGEDRQGLFLCWRLDANGAASGAEDLTVTTRVRLDTAESRLACKAALVDAQGETRAAAELTIKVKRMADSLKYLPELYRRDDFMNRFLMLFESFWQPISRQIDTAYTTFDPTLAPAEFLPWLGSWFGLMLAEDLPEQRQRDLLASIAPIFATTGTKQALITFLQMVTGGEVEVVEYMDSNLVLGENAHLGYQVALGTENRPHSFDVLLRVPYPCGERSQEDEQLTQRQYRRKMEALINTIKPAHTHFRLDLTLVRPTASKTSQQPPDGAFDEG
jgi:phage tail-like protein